MKLSALFHKNPTLLCWGYVVFNYTVTKENEQADIACFYREAKIVKYVHKNMDRTIAPQAEAKKRWAFCTLN